MPLQLDPLLPQPPLLPRALRQPWALETGTPCMESTFAGLVVGELYPTPCTRPRRGCRTWTPPNCAPHPLPKSCLRESISCCAPMANKCTTTQLQTRASNVVLNRNDLEPRWQFCKFVVWQWCGNGVAVVWQWCGSGVAVVWQWCGSGVAVVWQWCGSGVAVVWQFSR